jgi:signal transduction histidine kinase
MSAGDASGGVRILRALSIALDGGSPGDALDEVAGALVPELADGCALRCTDATGRAWLAQAGVIEGEGLERDLRARGGPAGTLRLLRAGRPWDDLAVLLADEVAARLGDALTRERLAAAAATAELYDRFLATLSHELRTPLGVIVGWVGLLQREGLPLDKRRQAVDVIARNTHLQTRLVEDILEVARIVAGTLRLELGTVPATDLVLGAVEAVRPQAEAMRLELAVEAGPAFELRADGTRLAQVVHNLIGNALRFTPPGGRIDVGIRRDGETAVLTVADTGIGIDPALLPHVFERFRQGERRRQGGSRGLGLGLFIVRHLVHLHGGAVTATSAGAGQGTCVTVRLPLGGPPDAAAPPG